MENKDNSMMTRIRAKHIPHSALYYYIDTKSLTATDENNNLTTKSSSLLSITSQIPTIKCFYHLALECIQDFNVEMC